MNLDEKDAAVFLVVIACIPIAVVASAIFFILRWVNN
jgi:hypothetical protein